MHAENIAYPHRMRFAVACLLVACSGSAPRTVEPEHGTEPDLKTRSVPNQTDAVIVEAPADAGPDAANMTAVEMSHVKTTKFRMGSRTGHPDERPVHQVTVAAFAIDLTEVTLAAYTQCVDAKQCTVPDLQSKACNWNHPALALYPVNCVNFAQASAYCAYVGKRLPTEEEWELAARGTDQRTYPWGNDVFGGEECELGTSGLPLCPVGSAPAGRSAFGVLDMIGNADEWTSSTYCPYDKPACGDPRRSTRGGASDFIGGTATSRTATPPNTIGDALGFRCARTD